MKWVIIIALYYNNSPVVYQESTVIFDSKEECDRVGADFAQERYLRERLPSKWSCYPSRVKN